jgi:hypothetical protein
MKRMITGCRDAIDPDPALFKMSSGDSTVSYKKSISRLFVAALCFGGAAVLNVAQAFDFGNMMNPSRWFDNDRYDRGYYGGYGPYGYGRPYGYGYGGPWGYGGYGPYGYGGPYGGWGYPGYGNSPSTIVVNPSSGSGNEAAPPPRTPE